MGPSIRVLDATLASQIAAGEVVERPASVVKELLENAVDAAACAIHVAIQGGGVDLVRVSDDGSGMGRADAALSVERHATSKIRSIEDLGAIRTLGFRGEALAAIASVSKLALTTRLRDETVGTEVTVEGGGPTAARDCGCAPGTTVEIRNLFFNVPARRKFLRSEAAESAAITEVCVRTALAQPSLLLRLERGQGRIREFLPASSLGDRVRAVFAADALEEVAAERDGVTVRAWLGAPDRARSGANGLHVFVNGRPVRDRAMVRAIAFAYGSVLAAGRYPAGAVYIELEPGSVDVNVHPQKSEVRFAGGHAVHDAVTRSLANALSRVFAVRSTQVPTDGGDGAPDPWGLAPGASEGLRARLPVSPYGAESANAIEPAWLAIDPTAVGSTGLRVLGQAHRMFIVCVGRDALHVFDQHAADERVRYAQLRRAFDAGAIARQALLFPERVELSEPDAAAAQEHAASLQKMGIDCSMIGPTTAAVHAIPAIVARASAAQIFRDALGELMRESARSFGEAVDRAYATFACHAAVRAGDELSPTECTALVRAISVTDEFAGYCPHGRPVVVEIPFAELERKFGR